MSEPDFVPTGREFYPENVAVAYRCRPREMPPLNQHPLVLEMIKLLPPPNAPWSKADQALWLQTLADIFQILCPIPERIVITLEPPT